MHAFIHKTIHTHILTYLHNYIHTYIRLVAAHMVIALRSPTPIRHDNMAISNSSRISSLTPKFLLRGNDFCR